MGIGEYMRQDWDQNEPVYSRVTVTIFRLGQLARWHRWLLPVWAVVDAIWTRGLMGAELPPTVAAGRGLRLNHGGRGVILHYDTQLGEGVVLYHHVTIGRTDQGDELVPRLGDGVYVGAGAAIIGGITVGDGARIGANAVVTHDVPAHMTAVGVPAQIRQAGYGAFNHH